MEEAWKEDISKVLREVTGLEPRNFSTIDAPIGEDPIQTKTVSVELPISRFPDPIAVVKQVREKMADSSYLVFLGTAKNIYEESSSTVEIVIGRGKSQEDIIRLARTEAPNYDLDTEGVIERMAKLYEHAEIGILGAAIDSVSIEIKEVKTSLTQLAEALFEVCGDLSQSDLYSNEEALAEYLKDNNFVFLWWD